MRHSVTTTVAQRRVPLMRAVSDVHRDWRRWSAAAQICVITLGGLWAAGVTAAIFADAHLLAALSAMSSTHPDSDAPTGTALIDWRALAPLDFGITDE